MNVSSAEKIVYIVHCIDAEGPLTESLIDTFGRLRDIFGIDMEAIPENLAKLQRGEVDLGDRTERVQQLLDDKLLSYRRNWQEISEMLDRITDRHFRARLPDSNGNGWIFSWFCVDHVGYTLNPRNRDLGHHRVFDFYINILKHKGNERDNVFFHYHPLPYNKMAHSCATSYFNGNHLYEILARKIIDRHWFPSVFRPGFHTTRPDSNFFLEQWLPFDFANQSVEEDVCQPDIADGRFGDWRRAPRIWSAYHPDHDDYQAVGSCRRWIFRCLNMKARLRELALRDVEASFAQASENGSAVLSFTNHDFRDMESEINNVREMVTVASRKWPGVKYLYRNALEAAREHLGLLPIVDIGLEVFFHRRDHGSQNVLELHVKTKEDLFGPQPFLAIKDKDGGYYYDNFDFTLDKHCWKYIFDWQTFLPEHIDKIGVVATGKQGQVEIAVYDSLSSDLVINRLNYA